MVSDPLNMFDVAPNADGAAALILTRPSLLPPGFPHRLVRIAGSSMATDTLALHDRPIRWPSRQRAISVERACQQAHITPLQVDLFELHDAYSIYAALSLEAAGFAQRGEGWKLAQSSAGSSRDQLAGLAAHQHPGRAESARQSRAAQPASTRRSKRCCSCAARPGANQVPEAQPGPDPVPGRPGFHCRHPRAGSPGLSICQVLDSLIGKFDSS